ncbi:MBL fold metallo-hydrolase [Hymenobacter actinosclerus]|uniref:L-ascorbate metabolism protein UlaG, beta-lactamase superfamily n=1 Tax=Hymenobacter actinosclerus TaxID=82805 RepID=A0A1I0DRR0_9BACT|nr:MBL fold metallo-hydrolase [Hymenobacter actinosclerus]SET35290.1 L-ascorbate metabolism protein UlaG, beta-lactamase superfamily [Hymenobacter actinosclerus]
MPKSRHLTRKITLSLLAALLLAGVAFAGLSPQLGGTPTKAEKAGYARSGHYKDGKFYYPWLPTELTTGRGMASVLWEFLFNKTPGRKPPGPLPMQLLDSLRLVGKAPELLRVTWFGHSASLLEIGGQNVLFDPMLGQDMGPVSWATPKRYNPRVPIYAAQLPPITAVLISHDHYDHLDYETIRQLRHKTRLFIVPLGVAAHLRAWGVDTARIRELDWNDSVRVAGLTIVSTPARHFSGRGLTNRNTTSFSSWVVKSATRRAFYSGDGGYGPHFAAIGRQHGPFDLGLMECGQYDPHWADIHMRPEQSVQAARDVRAAVMLPVHWGAFTEANHPWNEPPRRATAEAARLGQPITTPELGQSVTFDGRPLPQQRWWEAVNE